MSCNQILSKKTIGTIVKNGREIAISVATCTSKWIRPDVGVDAITNPFTAAVEDFKDELPGDTHDVCARSWVIRSSLSNTNPGSREPLQLDVGEYAKINFEVYPDIDINHYLFSSTRTWMQNLTKSLKSRTLKLLRVTWKIVKLACPFPPTMNVLFRT
jgi:hypothetical protein